MHNQHKIRQRQRHAENRVHRTHEIALRLHDVLENPVAGLCGSASRKRIVWEVLPMQVDPICGGRLNLERGQRKRQQIESVWAVLEPLVGDAALSICDFGSGSDL